jgi:rhodanese-related sulfurtransferase/ketosteroid isomerase-like protein
MAEHPNATLAREMTDAFDRGDMAALDRFIDDDVVWHEIGRSEPRRGKAALAAAAAADYTITGALHDVLANDEHTIALVEATATRNGRTRTYRTAEIYHIRNGRVVERWAFSDDTAAIAAFFAYGQAKAAHQDGAGPPGSACELRCADQRRETGVIPGSVHVPLSVLYWRLDPASGFDDPRLSDPARHVVLLCADGYSSSLAAATLKDLGFARATDVVGGVTGWKAAGLPLELP